VSAPAEQAPTSELNVRTLPLFGDSHGRCCESTSAAVAGAEAASGVVAWRPGGVGPIAMEDRECIANSRALSRCSMRMSR
jgi:hypothetical protein